MGCEGFEHNIMLLTQFVDELILAVEGGLEAIDLPLQYHHLILDLLQLIDGARRRRLTPRELHMDRKKNWNMLKEKLPQAFIQIGWMENDLRNLTVKVSANLDNPIKSYASFKV